MYFFRCVNKTNKTDCFPKTIRRYLRVWMIWNPAVAILIWNLLFCLCCGNQGEDEAPVNESPVKSYSTSTVSNDWIVGDLNPEEDVDIVSKFLRYVEKIEQNMDHCTSGTSEEVLDRGAVSYGPSRYMKQAKKTVDWANFWTRIWKNANLSRIEPKEDFFYNSVISVVENDDDIFAFGNCYDYMQFKNYELFCPYAYRQPNGVINVKDLSVEYKYLSNESEWFYEARMNANHLLKTRSPVKGKARYLVLQ